MFNANWAASLEIIQIYVRVCMHLLALKVKWHEEESKGLTILSYFSAKFPAAS